jgi:hypothetical protein
MFRTGFVILVMIVLAGCSNNQSSTSEKLDSIGKKFDSSAGRIWDSTKEKAKDIKAGLENRFNKEDSATKADTAKSL